MIIVSGFQPLTIITKCSILDVAAVLDPPLLIFKRFNTKKYGFTIPIQSCLKRKRSTESMLIKFLLSSELHKRFVEENQKILCKQKRTIGFKSSNDRIAPTKPPNNEVL